MMSARTLFPVILGWVLCGVAVGQTGRTADAPYSRAEGQGVIQAMDFATQSMLVSGYRYAAVVDVEVEIGGSYGAFTLLRPGMQIYFEYLVVSPSERWIVAVRELPPDVVVEET